MYIMDLLFLPGKRSHLKITFLLHNKNNHTFI